MLDGGMRVRSAPGSDRDARSLRLRGSAIGSDRRSFFIVELAPLSIDDGEEATVGVLASLLAPGLVSVQALERAFERLVVMAATAAPRSFGGVADGTHGALAIGGLPGVSKPKKFDTGDEARGIAAHGAAKEPHEIGRAHV